RPMEREVPGVQNGGALVSWAYRSELGKVSEAIELNDQYVVAILTEVYKEGPAPIEKVREDIKLKVITEKKKELLKQKLVDANKKDLLAISEQVGVQVEKITNASFDNALVSGLGEEKLLIGTVFGSKPNKLSEPIVGANAVFQFVLREFSEVQTPEDFSDIKKEKMGNQQGMAQYETMESLKELADIKDWRYKFF
ncbi:MAG: hypothetical protein H8E61_05650, partial [Bacteroidetes bacterium]|nr:hypothetical protein [Bacteroidota bacterium]